MIFYNKGTSQPATDDRLFQYGANKKGKVLESDRDKFLIEWGFQSTSYRLISFGRSPDGEWRTSIFLLPQEGRDATRRQSRHHQRERNTLLAIDRSTAEIIMTMLCRSFLRGDDHSVRLIIYDQEIIVYMHQPAPASNTPKGAKGDRSSKRVKERAG